MAISHGFYQTQPKLMEIVFFYWVYRPCNIILWLGFSNIGCASAKLMLNIIFTAQFSSGKLQRFTAQTHQQGLCCLYHIQKKNKAGPFRRVKYCDFWRHCAVESVSPEVWIGCVTSRPRVEWLRCFTTGGWGFVGSHLSDVFFKSRWHYFFFRKGVRGGE